MVTLKQIAAHCKVSVATVSKALNDAPDIGAETAARVRQAAKELGYFPNAAARSLKTHRSHNIGVLFEDETQSGLTHEYFTEVLNAVKTQAEHSGYDVTFISKDVGCKLGGGGYLEHCRYRNCDGVVIASVDFRDPAVMELIRSDIPAVTIDYVFDGNSAVLSDNVSGMGELAEYIYSLGHRRVAFIHGQDTAVTRARVAMFIKCFEEHGYPVPDEYVLPATYHDTKVSAKATGALLDRKDPPTCIIYPDDISMLGGISEIEKRGLTIPDDISIAGYDGIRISRLLRPAFTTYHQDGEQLGIEAVKLLIEQIESPKTFIPRTKTVKGNVQTGKTVRRLKA